MAPAVSILVVMLLIFSLFSQLLQYFVDISLMINGADDNNTG